MKRVKWIRGRKFENFVRLESGGGPKPKKAAHNESCLQLSTMSGSWLWVAVRIVTPASLKSDVTIVIHAAEDLMVPLDW